MKKFVLSVVVTLSGASAFADFASSKMTVYPFTTEVYSIVTGNASTTGFETKVSGMDVDDMKIVLNAQEDADYFVAAGGELKTALLAQAIQVVREKVQGASAASDMEIALFITQL
ncbi:hypothetical protein D3C72_1403890 [compost metagenome]